MPQPELDVEPGNCRACAADVLFVRSATSDERLILDAHPKKRLVVVDVANDDALIPMKVLSSIARNEVLFEEGRPRQPRVRVVDTWLDHHVTCIHAERFRKTSTRA